MINLIRNELFKLHRRKFMLICTVILLIANIAYATYYEATSDFNSEMDILSSQLDQEKAYMTTIDTIQWETELEMQAAILASQEKISRLQYMLDHTIASWDWRSDVLSNYYRNQSIISLLQNNQDPVAYGYDMQEFEGMDPGAVLTSLQKKAEQELALVEEDNYTAFCQTRLTELQSTYSELYATLSPIEIASCEIQMESWKMYIQYQTPPFAKDQWKSMAIAEIADQKMIQVQAQMGELEGEEEEIERQVLNARRTVAVYMHALDHDIMPFTCYINMAESGRKSATYAGYMYNSAMVMNVLIVLSICLASIIMSTEFRRDTIKSLLMIPASRTRIAMAKLIALIIVMFAIGTIVPVFSAVAGRILFSRGTIGTSLSSGETPVYITYLKGHVIVMPFNVFIITVFGVQFLKALIMSIIALTISTLTEGGLGSAIILSILAMIGNYLLEAFYLYVYPLKLLRYLLFSNFDLMQYITRDYAAPYATAVSSIVVLAIVTLISILIYLRDFQRKEITQ